MISVETLPTSQTTHIATFVHIIFTLITRNMLLSQSCFFEEVQFMLQSTRKASPSRNQGRHLRLADMKNRPGRANGLSHHLLSNFAYFLRKRSIRPAVSTKRCLPVKKGWQLEQISTCTFWLLVDKASTSKPQAQVILALCTLGWMFCFMTFS